MKASITRLQERHDLGDYVDRLRFPADPWRLTETAFDDDDIGTSETLFSVGNGYLGLRGNVEEGHDFHSHGTFINGFHETWPIRHAEEAYGFARTGQTIVNVPDCEGHPPRTSTTSRSCCRWPTSSSTTVRSTCATAC